MSIYRHPRSTRIALRNQLMIDWAVACVNDCQILWRCGYPSVVTEVKTINGQSHAVTQELIYSRTAWAEAHDAISKETSNG